MTEDESDPVHHFFTLHTYAYLAIPAGSDGKESACNGGDPGLIPGLEDPLEKEMATYFSIVA